MKRNDDIATVPFYAFEAAQYRADRANRRLCLVVGLIGLMNSVAWILGLLGRQK